MPAVQARYAAPLLPATPAADILGVDAADDKRPPLGLPCEPATRRLGSAAPTGCRAQLYFRWKHRCLARSTLALVHGQGFRHLLFLEGWSEGCCHQPQGTNQIHGTSQRFLAGEDSILLKISLKLLQDILEGPFDTVGSLQRAYTFQQLAASDLIYGQRLIDESEGGHSVDDEYLRASHWRPLIEFLTRNKMRVPSPNPTKRSSQNAIMFACRAV